WLSRMSERHSVPTNALLVACVVPILICLYVYAVPDQLPRITAFAVLGIYIAFQAVVLAALRQRLKGWRPAGNWNLGRYGFAVNVLALCYGIFAMVLLANPAIRVRSWTGGSSRSGWSLSWSRACCACCSPDPTLTPPPSG